MLFLVKILLGLYLLGCVTALGYNYWIKDQGAKGIEWKQCLNPIKHLSVFVGFALYFIIPPHINEQITTRLYDDYCRPNCLLSESGRCDSCGCKVAAQMYSPFEEDSRNNWGKLILSKKKYEEFRKEYPVKIAVTYGN